MEWQTPPGTLFLIAILCRPKVSVLSGFVFSMKFINKFHIFGLTVKLFDALFCDFSSSMHEKAKLKIKMRCNLTLQMSKLIVKLTPLRFNFIYSVNFQ